MIYPIYPIDRSNGIPVMGIGGGAFTKMFQFRTVLTKKDNGRHGLKPALFIRQSGDRSCRTDQGFTEIQPGDIIVEGSGQLPIVANNPGIHLLAFYVEKITGYQAEVTEIPFFVKNIPAQVITGASIYHNRDGSYFCEVEP